MKSSHWASWEDSGVPVVGPRTVVFLNSWQDFLAVRYRRPQLTGPLLLLSRQHEHNGEGLLLFSLSATYGLVLACSALSRLTCLSCFHLKRSLHGEVFAPSGPYTPVTASVAQKRTLSHISRFLLPTSQPLASHSKKLATVVTSVP